MPSAPAILTVFGLSTSTASSSFSGMGGFGPVWYPDPYVRPFNIGILVTSCVGAPTYNIEHTQDYFGQFSSNFNGFISSNATWFQNTGITGATTYAQGNYAFPVSAIRLNVTAGSSQSVTIAKIIQAG